MASISTSDARHRRHRRLYYQARPAVQTLASLALVLGLVLSGFVLLLVWVRTPQAILISTDPTAPPMMRGGESLRSILPWAARELWPGLALVLAGVTGRYLTARLRPGATAG